MLAFSKISTDEVMVTFKDRSSMKPYIPSKPVKQGFKVWMRADSHDGYISEFVCYTEKKDEITKTLELWFSVSMWSTVHAPLCENLNCTFQ